MMTSEQATMLQRLQSRTRQKLEVFEYGGDVFTENQAVTIKIGPAGGIEIPALRSYDDPFEAAVDAGRLFRLQQERDSDNPERAYAFTTGHFNPRWDPHTGRCVGSGSCPRCKVGSK